MFFKNKINRYVFLVSLFICILYPLINIYFIYPKFPRLLVMNTTNEAVRVGNHLSEMFFKKDGLMSKDRIEMIMNNKSHNLIHDFNLMKMKIFGPSGETIYSTTKSDIGKINKHD